MKNYQYVENPKSLIGKCFETRDSRFGDTHFRILNAYWACDNNKELCIEGRPDTLQMLYTLLPNEEGKYNLERVANPCRDICRPLYCRRKNA